MTPDPSAGLHEAAPSAAPPPPGQPWTVLRMILWSADYLTSKHVERGRLDAEYLLADTLGLDRLQLYLQYDRPLTSDELDAYRPRLQRRASREPLQYVLGRAPFRELELIVDSRVLVPRPETEGLVDHVLRWAADRSSDSLAVLDLCTGSGAIALSLATEGSFGRIVGSDASAPAVDVARQNAAALDVRIDWRVGSGFAPIPDGETFDIVVSNPPYVQESERDALAPEVRDFEPGAALFAGADGLDTIRAILRGVDRVLAPGGLFALEIGADQGPAVAELAESTSALGDVRLYRDLSSRDRYVTSIRTGA